jgi:hypothetical protein
MRPPKPGASDFFATEKPVYSCIAFRCLVLAGATAASLLGAGQRSLAGDNVKVCVVTILASPRTDGVDPRLKGIAEEIQKKKSRLKGFQLADMTCSSLATGEKWVIKLVDGQKAEVVIDQSADKDDSVVLRVRAPLQGEIKYRTVCGKFLPIVTRYKTKDKRDRLILAIMVKPCQRDKAARKKK